MSTPSTKDRSLSSAKYLTLQLANEGYGVAVLSVREIIRLQTITPVPQMPAHIKGVINLRGRVVPVVDLRLRFGLPADLAERTCIVVVQLPARAASPVLMGVVVDGVEEVVSLTSADIEPPPAFGTAVDTSYVLGMAKVKGQVKILLDIDRLLSRAEPTELFQAA